MIVPPFARLMSRWVTPYFIASDASESSVLVKQRRAGEARGGVVRGGGGGPVRHRDEARAADGDDGRARGDATPAHQQQVFPFSGRDDDDVTTNDSLEKC